MLNSLRLTDFKSFVDETIPLAPVTFLVGANAAGKSNDLGRRARVQVLANPRLRGVSQALDQAGWKDVRSERDPKERFARPLLSELAGPMALGGGRVRAMSILGQRWKSLLPLCPELERLRQRLETWMSKA